MTLFWQGGRAGDLHDAMGIAGGGDYCVHGVGRISDQWSQAWVWIFTGTVCPVGEGPGPDSREFMV